MSPARTERRPARRGEVELGASDAAWLLGPEIISFLRFWIWELLDGREDGVLRPALLGPAAPSGELGTELAPGHITCLAAASHWVAFLEP